MKLASSFLTSLGKILTSIPDLNVQAHAKTCVTNSVSSSLALALFGLCQYQGTKQAKPSDASKQDRPPAQSWLIITDSEPNATQFFQDLQFYYSVFGTPQEELVHFPQWASLPYQSSLPPTDVIARRACALHRLTTGKPTVLVTSIFAILQKVLPQDTFFDACFSLDLGHVYEHEPLIEKLLRLGYRRVSIVEIPGEFSVRGGIMDIFSTAFDDPLRVEFLGDTIDSLRVFDPSTQESIQKLSEAWILPVREFLVPDDQHEQAGQSLASDAEWYAPNLYGAMESIADYFQTPPHVVLHHPLALPQAASTYWNEILDIWDQQAAPGQSPGKTPYPEPDRLYHLYDDILATMQSWPTLGMDSIVPAQSEDWQHVAPFPAVSAASLGLGLKGVPLKDNLAKLEQLRSQGPVFLIARSAGQVERLLGLLSEQGYPASAWDPSQRIERTEEERFPFYCLQGELSSGLITHEGSLAFITEEELFGKGIRHRPLPKTHTAKFLSSLDDLQEGDLVVHVHHGISRYQGLRRLSVHDSESDYLLLQFAGTDTLYVPLERLSEIQPYHGVDQRIPKLDKLGGTSWARTKAKVKKSIEDMAEELVALYANREIARRTAYSPDTMLTHEFEAAFDYEETPGQLKAIEDIYRDMESPKPMDRLVCGDVGYGKTEVAMRAAFKAVQNNRQVAVLVPTTLLAQQHYETFSLRFAPFPVRVGMLTRFQSPAECKTILRDIAAGTLDIIIGTHRLLTKGVQFKNLGIVITDEEQWFGVRHKERLKQLRTQVDVLTLSATPIPRTLQMALSGVRDLSVIESPPTGRLAIQTQVLRFDGNVIREAIHRELGRGGQVFYLHNRIETMERTGTWLQQLIPEARVVIAHGQMDERLLESVMLKFFHHEADVLIATAIIQSGLDIPNANTILIDRADLFGLAQLYQLRGRVGRGGQQAYAYFFVPNEETLSTDAQKRLNAIQEFTELGSGFRIAAADMEIRGAGNLLGKQQSGNIAVIGLDLYLHMVEQAVQQLRGQVVEKVPEPTLHLHVSAFIPEDYVDDTHQRLNLYKRLSGSEQIGDLALLHGETQDRYGPLPAPVERLYEVMQIKLLAKALKLESVNIQGRSIIIAFHEVAKLPEDGIQWLLDRCQDTIQFLSPLVFQREMPSDEWAVLYPELNTILQGLHRYSRTQVEEQTS
ncbi:MAG: transcription-repair-coupling factor [Nitrospirales bacterium]|nr:MAG: transcription-repair-coupling factor [Nitrospirales bacterium]